MQTYRVDWYHRVPPHVKGIIERLDSLGRRAYIVGGAVRDLWLGLEPQDFDLVSQASVDEIAENFPRTTSVGKQFGIMVVVTEEGPVEVARFRTDGDYTDSRHPDSIEFADPAQDAQRRDFTMNALFYDPLREELIDYVGGVADLENRVVRCVGEPARRFEEDALRMLRAVRFHCQLAPRKFTLHEGLLEAIRPLAHRLEKVSKERITQEMGKALSSLIPSLALRDLIDSQLWEPVLLAPLPPAFAPVELDESLKEYRRHFNEDRGLAFSLAFLEARVPGFSAEKAFLLPKSVKIQLREAAALAPRLAKFDDGDLAEKKIILLDPGFPLAWATHQIPGQEELPPLAREWDELGRLNPPAFLDGKDLIEMGVPPGKKIREILDALRREQLNETVKDAAAARAWVTKFI